jgi:hypothetical protein
LNINKSNDSSSSIQDNEESDDEHDGLLLFPFISPTDIGEQGTTLINNTRISSRLIRATKKILFSLIN